MDLLFFLLSVAPMFRQGSSFVARVAAFDQRVGSRILKSRAASTKGGRSQPSLLPRTPSFATELRGRNSPGALRPTPLAASTQRDVASSAYGSGMDQNAMMESDLLVAVDTLDREVPGASVSKREAHLFGAESPRGVAHRAFSVFLFNGRDELLLTRRALSKITFPGVWTNTCCSHPLHGMTPEEVDDGVESYPDFPGIKHAAIRKLSHELGIVEGSVPHSDFRFLTRFHYWAADTVTYGDNSPWGEHEIDYVLFVKCDGDGPAVSANPDEVDEYRYVTASELKAMMKDDSYLWSPWFCGIMERGGFEWWEDLDEALKAEGSKYCNQEITYFDPPKEHMGCYNLESHGKEVGVLVDQKDA